MQRAKQEASHKAELERSRARDLERQVEQLTAERHKLQSHAKRRMEQVQWLERQRDELEEAVIGMKEEADGHAEAAKVAQAEAADLRQRLRLTEAELQATVAGSDCAAQDIREMRQQHERSDAERQQLRERVTSLEHALADAEAALAQNRRLAYGELGPSEREAAARDRAEMQLLQGELSGMLGKMQLAKTALSSAQHQVAHWKRKAERLEQAAEAQAKAAVVEKENERCARSHAQQAVTWVQRLRAEVVAAGELAEQLQASKATLVHEKLNLAHALQRSTQALTGLREGAEQPGGGVEADKVESAAWEEVARAIQSEQGHLGKLELEMRRVLALERLRLSDLREMQCLQERLNSEIDVAWRLREKLAEQKLQSVSLQDCEGEGG
ncbi:hypothetical protein COCSUDRAFT_42877 [Coccomyxa subellipsoidea C-169]|uniref:Uncharacterized protein n=1 Tax=Coccomyxa subellipsoidea (strain C-169) TaxID=574566 RepID=I0YTX0_COCSC|nr:hypothetical protein COCSUDRAFT_42877 [Coccomyxa subellipsoidea C-169]EIE21839.1 hypothetical protein COCSUDRAFT_42877 [Coccomyxa subellipsoidea C-169]|eukprot:XP_005646383.1 hypothetical protein COCSUDRAFT_42877 [Coccomyxa subellipsoidea C-169]